MITIALVRPKNPGNIGFIARAMANFDFSSLILIDPLCDHLSEEAVKTSSHAKDILKKAKVKAYDYLFHGAKKDFTRIVGTTSVMGTDYNVKRTPLLPEEFAGKIGREKIALVFGNEATGLVNEEIAACDLIVTIPTSRKYPAMNISHACAVMLYEISKRAPESIVSHIDPATRKEREIICSRLDNIFDRIEFATKEKKETQQVVWKRVFEKSMISKREAFAVMGFLRKIEDRISKKQSSMK